MQPSTKDNRAGQLREKVSEVVEDVKDLGSLARSAAREHLDDTCTQGREAVRQVEKQVEQYVSTNPLRSLIIAGGVGFLVGWLWRRR